MQELSPTTKVNVDEIGSIGGCNDVTGKDRWYFNAIAAVYAYVYANLAAIGVCVPSFLCYSCSKISWPQCPLACSCGGIDDADPPFSSRDRDDSLLRCCETSTQTDQ